MAATCTLAMQVMRIFLAIAIPFTFPLRGDESPFVGIERGAQLIQAGKYDQAESVLGKAKRTKRKPIHSPVSSVVNRDHICPATFRRYQLARKRDINAGGGHFFSEALVREVRAVIDNS